MTRPTIPNNGDADPFMQRGRFSFKVTAFFWDSFRTWHNGSLRHIGFFHKRPEKVDQGNHAERLLSGFCELMKMLVDTCYYRRPLNPTLSPVIGYYCYDLFRTILETDRLHMSLHDLASEINQSLVANRGSCYVCAMARSFGSIIHSGLGNAWGHPMTWHGMASGHREGLFLVGLFRMALHRVDEAELSPVEIERMRHCYDLLMQLLYMTQAEAERRLTGGVSVGIQQFQIEVESVLDSFVPRVCRHNNCLVFHCAGKFIEYPVEVDRQTGGLYGQRPSPSRHNRTRMGTDCSLFAWQTS